MQRNLKTDQQTFLTVTEILLPTPPSPFSPFTLHPPDFLTILKQHDVPRAASRRRGVNDTEKISLQNMVFTQYNVTIIIYILKSHAVPGRLQ